MNVIGGESDGGHIRGRAPQVTLKTQTYLGVEWKDEHRKSHIFYILPDTAPVEGLKIYQARLGLQRPSK